MASRKIQSEKDNCGTSLQPANDNKMDAKVDEFLYDYDKRAVKRPRPYDPVSEKPLDTPKIAKIGQFTKGSDQPSVKDDNISSFKNNDEKTFGPASPKPSTSGSTSTSKDKSETVDQELLLDSEQIEDDEEVENLRIQYIALIEKINGKLSVKEQELTFNDIKRDELKNNLKERQDIEKGNVDIKFHPEINELEEDMVEKEKQWAMAKKRWGEKKDKKRKESEEVQNRHRDEKNALDIKLGKEQEHDKNAVDKLKEKINKLAIDLRNLTPDPNLEAARATLECPICMELMKPPTKIWMCSSNHIVCEPCKNKLKGKRCPTCRIEKVTLRALFAENVAKSVFNDAIFERKIQVTVKSPEKSKASDGELQIKKGMQGECPMCQKKFWMTELESHAAECEGKPSQQKTLLCPICLNFLPRSTFQAHCKACRQEEMDRLE